LIKFHSHCLP